LLIFQAFAHCFLRFPEPGIIIAGDNNTPNRVVDRKRSSEPFRPSLFRLSCRHQMEAAMRKLLVTAIASLALVSGSLLIANRAEAGASASAPSKYSNQAASAHQVRTVRHENFPITEYSSSSARSPRH
jgi:hypothetical protein